MGFLFWLLPLWETSAGGISISVFFILHGALDISPASIDITYHTGTTTHGSHQWKLNQVSASDKHSPLWKKTVPRTIPQWNKLSSQTVSADSLITFQSRLSANPYADLVLCPTIRALPHQRRPAFARSWLTCSPRPPVGSQDWRPLSVR